MSAPTFVRAGTLGFVTLVLGACGTESPPAVPAAQTLELRAVAFPGAAGSTSPRLSVAANGQPVVSWLEPQGDLLALRFARYSAGAFGAPGEVTRGANLLANWVDLPSVQPIAGSLLAAHWLTLAPDSAGAYHIATAVSNDAGATWSAPVQLNDDSAAAEHGFVQVFPWNGGVGAYWLDGRQLAEWSFDEPDKLLGTSLRVARLDNTGAVTERVIADELVCDCCQPDLVMLADGPVIAYRDRTPEEIRDIAVRRFRDGRWQEAVIVAADNWHIEGCPVNGPSVAAASERVAVGWFTAAEGQPRVRFAWSSDGAATFSPAIDVDGAGAFGQVGVLLDDDGAALVNWWRAAEGGGMDLALRTVGPDGTQGELRVLAHSSAAQPVDVPQLVRVGDELLLVSTNPDDGVRAALVANYR